MPDTAMRHPMRKKPSTRPAPSLPAVEPPSDSHIQPISEGQFAALVNGFEVHESERGTTYMKAGQPWLFTRRDPYVIVTHRSAPFAPRYYEIV